MYRVCKNERGGEKLSLAFDDAVITIFVKHVKFGLYCITFMLQFNVNFDI